MQFGAEPLFENISAKFGHGNRYGLIGANGCGKSTFMKITRTILGDTIEVTRTLLDCIARLMAAFILRSGKVSYEQDQTRKRHCKAGAFATAWALEARTITSG